MVSHPVRSQRSFLIDAGIFFTMNTSKQRIPATKLTDISAETQKYNLVVQWLGIHLQMHMT